MNAMRQLGLIALAVFLLTNLSSASGKNSTCPASPNVTSTVHDYDTSGAQLLVRSDDYNGAGQATYSVADANVSSSVYCGEWFLKLYSQSLRTAWITPNQPINGSQPAGPPPGYYWQDVEIASGCSDQNGNVVYYQNVLTSSNTCNLIIDFYANGLKYKLAMGQKWAGSALVTVTCGQAINNQCDSWTITPSPLANGATPATVANLYYYGKGGKLVFVGQYYNTFRFDVTP